MKSSENLYAITTFKDRYDFLSNFYPIEIEYDGIIYPSAEHAYQAAKTMDIDTRIKISKISSAPKAKREGFNVKSRKDWNNIKSDIMYEILKIKFSNPDLKDRLLSTNQAILIEGNWWADTYWGCIIKHENEYSGLNTLGNLLMKIRDECSVQNDLVY